MDRSTARNALVGGVISTVLLVFPFLFGTISTFFGGASAGYLEGGSNGERVVVGMGVGVVTFLLLFAVVLVLGNLFDLSATVPVVALQVRLLGGLLQLPSFLLLSLGVLPVAGAWTGGFAKAVVENR